MDLLETPSRIMRRMAEYEAREANMPSLPSLSVGMDDSMAVRETSSRVAPQDVTTTSESSEEEPEEQKSWEEPLQSTPMATAYANSSRTIQKQPRSGSSSASRVRFANSVATRSIGGSTVRPSNNESFDASRIPHARFTRDESISDRSHRSNNSSRGDLGSSTSHTSLPAIYLPSEDDEDGVREGVSIVDALQSVSRSSSPPLDASVNKSLQDFDTSIRSAPKQTSPFDPSRWGAHISRRKINNPRRVPSLTHSQSSDTSASSNATPSVHISLPLTSPSKRELLSDEEEEEEDELEAALSQDEHSIQDQEPLHNEEESVEDVTDRDSPSEEQSFSEPSREQASPSNHSPAAMSQAFSAQSPYSNYSPNSAHQATPMAKRAFGLVTASARPRLKTPNSQQIGRPRFSLPQSRFTPSALLAQSPGNDSFISTASSHDLAIHPRANVSFDHIADRVGKLDKVKLQSYLASVNRRLHEENDTLHGNNHQLIQQIEDYQRKELELLRIIDMLRDGVERNEDMIAQLQDDQMLDDIAGMDANASSGSALAARPNPRELQLEMEVERLAAELEDEKRARQDASFSYQRRLEAEQGSMRLKMEAEFESKAADLERTSEMAIQKMEKELSTKDERLSRLKSEVSSIQSQLALSDNTVEQHEEEIRVLKERLEQEGSEGDQVRAAEERAEELREARDRAEKKTLSLQRDLHSLEAKCDGQEDELARQAHQMHELKGKLEQSDTQVKSLKQQVAQHGQQTHAKQEEWMLRLAEAEQTNEQLASQLASKQDSFQASSARFETLERDLREARQLAERAESQAASLQEALTSTEQRIMEHEAERTTFGLKLASVERERRELEILLAQVRAENESESNDGDRTTKSRGEDDEDRIPFSEHERMVAELESQLDDAHRQIGRLQYDASNTSSRRALDQAKEMRIEFLENDKRELMERVEVLKESIANLTPGAAAIDASMRANTTINKSMMTPAIHRSVLALRTPRTPIPSLKDKSWMNDTVNVSSEVAILLAQIDTLSEELAQANDHVDEKVGALESAGLGIIGLTKQLEEQKDRNVDLQRHVEHLTRREDRIVKRLERCKCGKCGKRFDASSTARAALGDVSNTSIQSEAESSHSRSIAIHDLNQKLGDLRAELEGNKQRLEQEKASLQDQARKLNVRVQTAETARAELSVVVRKERKAAAETLKHIKDEAEKQYLIDKIELDKAQSSIKDLEGELKRERSKLRSLTSEQDRLTAEKRTVLKDLERVQGDMADVKKQLEAAKEHGTRLEAKMRDTSQVARTVQTLKTEVSENQALVGQLRQERDGLSSDHNALQKRYSDLTKHVDTLRQQVSSFQATHDARRHQLDLQVTELQELRATLGEKAATLRTAEKDKQRIGTERTEYANALASYQADLQRVQKEASQFRRDLTLLKEEKNELDTKMRKERTEAERSKIQHSSQLRLLQEHLAEVQEKAHQAEEALAIHAHSLDGNAVGLLREQHKKECKGLITQIRYLKAKFTRESVLRNDLTFQKGYLLRTIEAMEQSEESVLATIARIGFPKPAQPPKRRTLKAVASMVIFVSRVKKISDAWREQSRAKQAISAALQDVRKRRHVAAQ